MTRQELHNELSEYLYITDYSLVDTLIASVIANARKIGDPVWLTLIGPSSAGKSQYIRPLAKGNPDLFLQLDDLTPNSLLSGNGIEQSALNAIKEQGIISMDDLTVLFSKNAEDRNAILAQFRMLYDGRITKATGRGENVTWSGHAGMIAGSTPAIYRHFSEVADMGERFVNYRMKPMDEDELVDFVMKKQFSAKKTDDAITEIYNRYFSQLLPKIPMEGPEDLELDQKTQDAIVNISKVGTKLRTPVILDDRENLVSEFPVQEMPIRVMKQLMNVAKSFAVMQHAETGSYELSDDLREAVEWLGWSLSDDKRRSYVQACVALEGQMIDITERNVAAYTGLHQTIVSRGMSILTAIGVLELNIAKKGGNEKKVWKIKDRRLKDICQRLDPPKVISEEDYKEDHE